MKVIIIFKRDFKEKEFKDLWLPVIYRIPEKILVSYELVTDIVNDITTAKVLLLDFTSYIDIYTWSFSDVSDFIWMINNSEGFVMYKNV